MFIYTTVISSFDFLQDILQRVMSRNSTSTQKKRDQASVPLDSSVHLYLVQRRLYNDYDDDGTSLSERSELRQSAL